MRINKHLNLVIPITQDNDAKLFVHSTPISYEVYKANWRVLARTFEDIHTKGFAATGPRVAQLMLRDIAVDLDVWEGPSGVERSLIAQIHQLTNVLVPGPRGWEMIPFHDAKTKGTLDPEEADEIEGILIFFTAASHLHRRASRTSMLAASLDMWNAQIESLSCTEYLNSLPTLTTDENSGATAAE